MSDTAYEIEGDPRCGPLLFTCEHASSRVPEWEVSPADRPHLAEHWGYDLGAADLARALARVTGSAAVLSRFSRLVCDPSRHPDEPSFVVREVAGHRLDLNRDVDAAECARRRARYFDPYHAAVDRVLAARRGGPGVHLCSIHSFTPDWAGRRRTMEVGVLYDENEALAHAVAAALETEGFAVAHNEPYSGRAGLIYAAQRHGRAHGIPYLELEVRNDLLGDASASAAVAVRIARALAVYAPGAKR